MQTAVIIFIIVSSIFSIGSMVYVGADFIYEVKKNKVKTVHVTPTVPVVVPVVAPDPDPEPEPEVMPEIVEEINAEDADEMISDALALSTVIYEEETTHGGFKTFVNIGAINDAFEPGDTVDIDALKAKKLIPAKSRRVKVLADGILSKPLTVKANSYSVQAVKMIELTGGTVVLRKVAKNK